MADLPVPTLGADQVRRIADEVLARPEFLEAQPTWWQRLQRAVFDFISRVLEAMAGDGRGSIIGTVTIVAVVLALTYVIVRYTRTVRVDPRLADVTGTALGRSTADWAADAQACEASGQWRDAVRCRYRELLAALAGAGLLAEVPGRTSGEYLTAFATDVPDAAPAFTDATRRFEAAWYSHAATSAADVEAFRDAAGRTLDAAGVRRGRLAAAR